MVQERVSSCGTDRRRLQMVDMPLLKSVDLQPHGFPVCGYGRTFDGRGRLVDFRAAVARLTTKGKGKGKKRTELKGGKLESTGVAGSLV